ncbi:MAG: desulfoferrodoxin family protein [Candidatus Izemoplasma sp.]|nr:desulfoferrodoxin family protein [Candidatus Izemoplasma sp.]
MKIQTGNVNEEKHVPFIEELDNGYRVTMGKPAIHPMKDMHYIEYVELYVDDEMVAKKEFEPGDEPVAEFNVDKGKHVYARELCNVHGLWQGELE